MASAAFARVGLGIASGRGGVLRWEGLGSNPQVFTHALSLVPCWSYIKNEHF